MLSEQQCKNIIDQVVQISRAHETECLIQSQHSDLTRFANNVIHQNVSAKENLISIRVVNDKRMGRFTTNRVEKDALRQAVNKAIKIAELMPQDKDLLPMATPQSYPKISHYFEHTASYTAADRAKGVSTMVNRAKEHDFSAAGIFETGVRVTALGNSKGHFCYYRESHAAISVTVIDVDSSGYLYLTSANLEELAPAEIAQVAVDKATMSANPIEVEPGDYTVILEPQAVANLLSFLLFDYVIGASSFSALAVLEKRSFLSDKVGKPLFGNNITITDDVFHPLQKGPAFDYEGVPKKRVTLVENGVVKNLLYNRSLAKRKGVEPTGHGLPLPNTYGAYPSNVVLQGGDKSLADLIASTKKGILITRFWYNRLVESNRVVVTGTTRDGTFLIEDGQVRTGIQNMRFNQSVITMLNHVVAMTAPRRVFDDESEGIFVVPALKVEGFHFTKTT